MKEKLVALVTVMALYGAWVLIEHAYLSSLLQGLSFHHIKLFRMIAKREKTLDFLMSIASELGDKYGIIGCIWLSIHF